VTRWFRFSLSVADPFGCRCLNSWTILPSHTPLIEPDRPISGIRLSEKGSRCRPRDIARPLGKADEAQQLMQGCVRKPLGPQSPHFVLGAQPLTQPLASVLIHGPIGLLTGPRQK